MGNTQLQCVQLFSTGRLLLESFEFSTWLIDQGWTVARGTPVNSNAAAKDGAYSFPMDTSFPAISKVLAGVNHCVVYFYDDATQTASTFTPGVLWKGADGLLYGMGVSNATSSGFYTKWNNGVLSATTVARSTGWHRFLVIGQSGLQLSIDGTTILSLGAPTSPIQQINVIGSINATGTPFGYFDYVQAATDFNINMVQKNGIQPNVSVWAPATAPGATDTQVQTGFSPGSIDVSATDAPFAAYLRGNIVGSGAGNAGSPLVVSDIFPAMWPGDIYNLTVVDLGRKAIVIDPGDSINRTDTQSFSGKNESIIFNNRDMPAISINDLPNQLRLDLEAWWAWAKQSQSFSLAIDASSMFWGQLSLASGTNTVTVFTAGNVPGAANLQKGMEVRLRRYDNSYSEKKIISSVSGNVVTFTKNLERVYGIGDIIVSGLYWPRLISMDKKFRITLADPRVKRWNFALSAQENL